MLRFLMLLSLLLAASHAAAQGFLKTPSPGRHSLPPLTLEQVQKMGHNQMRSEMIRRGVSPQYADQAADYMQAQVRDLPPLKGPEAKPDHSGTLDVEGRLPVLVQLPADADVTYLNSVRPPSGQRVSIVGKGLRSDNATFGIINATDLNGALGLHNAIRHQNHGYVSRPRHFSIYGITRTNLLFTVNLHLGGGDLSYKHRFNVAGFRIGREHLPVKLYARDGGDIGWPMTGLQPHAGPRGPESKPVLLREYLEKHAELVLTYTGQTPGWAEISICFQPQLQKYVWVEAATRKHRGSRATW